MGISKVLLGHVKIRAEYEGTSCFQNAFQFEGLWEILPFPFERLGSLVKGK